MNLAHIAVLQMVSGTFAMSVGLVVILGGSLDLGVIAVVSGAAALGFSIQNWIDYAIKQQSKVNGYQRMVDEERYKAEVGK